MAAIPDKLVDQLNPLFRSIIQNNDTNREVSQLVANNQNTLIKSQIANTRQTTASAKSATNTSLLETIGKIVRIILTPIVVLFKAIGFVLGAIFYFLAPYIAIYIVIVVLIKGVRMSRNIRASGGPRGLFSRMWWRIKNLFGFGYQTKLFMRKFNPAKVAPIGLPRTILSEGKCDGFEWKEDGQGICRRTIIPKPIEWKLDSSTVSDLGQLPDIVADQVTKQGNLINVKIPWTDQGGIFLPQCSKSVFPDDNNSSAGYLFNNENNTTCSKAVLESTGYGVNYRTKNEKKLDNFASKENPNCSPSN